LLIFKATKSDLQLLSFNSITLASSPDFQSFSSPLSTSKASHSFLFLAQPFGQR
jgi:hypothetical protein